MTRREPRIVREQQQRGDPEYGGVDEVVTLNAEGEFAADGEEGGEGVNPEGVAAKEDPQAERRAQRADPVGFLQADGRETGTRRTQYDPNSLTRSIELFIRCLVFGSFGSATSLWRLMFVIIFFTRNRHFSLCY